jgi:hypothetical protein
MRKARATTHIAQQIVSTFVSSVTLPLGGDVPVGMHAALPPDPYEALYEPIVALLLES